MSYMETITAFTNRTIFILDMLDAASSAIEEFNKKVGQPRARAAWAQVAMAYMLIALSEIDPC